MKKALVRSFFILFFLVSASQAAGADSGCFVSYDGSLQIDPHSANPAIVLRQRLVSIRFELLPMTPGEAVTLSLFDDVALRAICDRVEPNMSDGFVWSGHVQNQPESLVTFTVSRQEMAGTVDAPPLLYHIRTFQGAVHVIREIRRPARRSDLSLADAGPSAVELEVLELVNLEREIENLAPLAWDNALGTAARGHSADMAQFNYFSHTSLDGRLFYQRITAAGYAYSTCGENIAAGYSSAQAVMNGWMTSPGHRANILNSAYCDIGVGYAFEWASTYGHYWTQDFGRRWGVSACPLPEYTITASAGLHGTIKPSGSVKVQSGADQAFQMTADAGYRILDVKIDGVSAGALAAHTFDCVTANHSIAASFEAIPEAAKPASWIPLLLLDN